MLCPGCGEKNRDGARFCTYCGAGLVARCPVCDNEVPPGGRFCDACGTPIEAAVSPPPEPAAARKIVTVLFGDLTGSTALEERMDAESVRAVLDRFYAAMRGEVGRHGGRVVKFTGDGVMAVFGVPDVREDDAARAIDAALAMRDEVASLAADLEIALSLKLGINTGEVVVSAADDDVVGDAVNVASRLEGAAGDGEILVGEDTWRLTRGTSRYEPMPPLTLKGKSEPVPAYRLLAVDERTAEAAAAPFVGRDAELETMLRGFEEAVAANAARLVTVIGAPGLGKTRLTRELAVRLGGRARVRETRCEPGSSTFAPIADAVRAAAAVSETDAPTEVIAKLADRLPSDDPDRDRVAVQVAGLLGVGSPGTTEESFWAVRRLVEAAAAAQPVVLVLDDLHWAEPILLDLVEHLAEWIRDAPVLLVGTARPELRDIRPSLAEGGRAAAVVALEGLDESATTALALNLLETDDLPGELLAKIPASTDGNPLFVRELVRMLVDDGVLLRTPDGWQVTVDVEAIEVPPTIQSLLAARVDRLRNDERVVVELASVLGKEFYRGALHDLAPEPIRDLVDGCLESLRRKELVEPAGTYWIDEPVYRFHHALIRDAAYRRVLKGSRAELHERVAGWLEAKTSDVLGEHDEVIGYHLEQAHSYNQQLRRADADVGRRAAASLGSAARRALDRGDLPAAAALSERALACLPDGDPERGELLLIACEASLSMGDVARGARALAGLRAVDGSPRLDAWAVCFTEHLANLTSPEGLEDTVERVAEAATVLIDLDDHAGAAKARTVQAATLARLGRFAECEAVLDGALTAARAANVRWPVTATLAFAPQAALWGPNPVSRAGGRCLDIVRLLRITTGSQAVEATSLRCQAVLESFRGRTDAARRMLRNARRTLTDLGLEHDLLETDLFAGMVELIDGQASEAIPYLRDALDGSRRMGVDVLAARAAAVLARAQMQLDHDQEAIETVAVAERTGSHDMQSAIAWRAVKAELLARAGSVDDAKRLAEEAVALGARTDALFGHGVAYRSLAAVLREAGNTTGAAGAEDRARALFERKGATAMLDGPEPEPVARAGGPRVAAGPSNAATEARARLWDALRDRDSEAAAALFTEDHVTEDRRPGFRTRRVGREAAVENFDAMLEVGDTYRNAGYEGASLRMTTVALATRGSRLALTRDILLGADGGEESVLTELRVVTEVDAEGCMAAVILFDPGSEDDAFAELEARYLAGEASVHAGPVALGDTLMRLLNERDYAHARTLFHPDATVIDRSPASRGEMSLDRFFESYRELVELTDELVVRTITYHIVDDGYTMAEAHNHGVSKEGAEVDLAYQVLAIHRDGRIARLELFAAEHVEQARARFAELVAARAPALENAASRGFVRRADAVMSGDWATYEQLLRPDAAYEDRRTGMHTVIRGRAAMRANDEAVVSVGAARVDLDVIAVRGARLALLRMEVGGDTPEGFVVEGLILEECDEEGRSAGYVAFDPADVDAAFAELDERFAAGEGASAAAGVRFGARLMTAHNTRDWDALREALADDFVVVDRRPASLGEIADPDAWVASVRTLTELTATYRMEIVAYLGQTPDVALMRLRNHGTTVEGGPIENSLLVVARVDGDRFHRAEFYPLEALPDATARFEALTAAAPPAQGKVGEHDIERSDDNVAVRTTRRIFDLMLQRAWEEARGLFTDDAFFEDRRRGLGVRMDGADARVNSLRLAAETGVDRVQLEPLAVRGDTLALIRVSVSGAGPGAYEADLVMLVETDRAGRQSVALGFDPSDAPAAFEELDARFAAGEGAEHAAAVRTAAGFMAAYNARDWARMRTHLTEDLVLVDHRPASAGEVRGPDGLVEYMQPLIDLSPDLHSGIARFHTLGPRAVAYELRGGGTTEHGGTIEIAWHEIASLRDGRVERFHRFDIDDLPSALAWVDRLAHPSGPPENMALRAMRASCALVERRDYDGLRALHAPECRVIDLRPGFVSTIDGIEAVIANARALAEVGVVSIEITPLATRGDRLELSEVSFRGPAATGFEAVVLQVLEVDASSRLTRGWVLDPAALDDAYAKLDEVFVEGEGSVGADVVRAEAALCRAGNVRDWDAFRALFADDFVLVDHRPASLGTIDADGWLEAQRAKVELVPSYRADVVQYHGLAPAAWWVEIAATGTTEHDADVAFHVHSVGQLRDGKIVRLDTFPESQRDEAASYFAGLVAPPDATLDNEAIAAGRRSLQTMLEGDLAALTDIYASDARIDDRRTGLAFEAVGRDAALRYATVASALMRATPRVTCLAARGERLALARLAIGDEGRDRWTSSMLTIWEVNDRGQLTDVAVFDDDDEDEAYATLDRRYPGDTAPHAEAWAAVVAFVEARNAGDWEGVRATMADDISFVDHRPASLGRGAGPDELVEIVRELTDVAAGYRMRIRRVVAADAGIILIETASTATNSEGGLVEFGALYLYVLGGGRAIVAENFALEQLDSALERFEALRGRSGTAPDNAAVSMARGSLGCIARRDWQGLADLYSSDVRLVDHRNGLQHEAIGRDAVVNFARAAAFAVTAPGRISGLAARGTHAALCRQAHAERWAATFLNVIGLDADGRIVAIDTFDDDDVDRAYAVLEERFLAGEGAPHVGYWATLTRYIDARRARDWHMLRSTLADDVRFVDHRRTSLGSSLWDPDQIVDAMRALADLVPDADTRVTNLVMIDTDIALYEIQTSGTNSEGGPVEIRYLEVNRQRDGRAWIVDRFDLDQLDEAKARFEELRGDPTDTTAAVQALERVLAAMDAGDWDAVAGCFAPGVVVVDERRGIASSGAGPRAFVENFRTVRELGFGPGSRRDVATRGDRLHLAYGAMSDAHGNVIDALVLHEVDADGLITRIVHFDADALDDAYAELDERYLAGEGAAHAAYWTVMIRYLQAHRARDWAAVGELLAEDVRFVDHRPASLGSSIGASVLVESMRALADVLPDVTIRLPHILAIDRGTALYEIQTTGTNSEGGQVELRFYSVSTIRDGRATDVEYFALEQLADARRRSDELARSSGASAGLENACTRQNDAMRRAYRARDWAATEAVVHPDVVFDDRRPGLGSRFEGRDRFIEQSRLIADMGADNDVDVIAVRGDRLALIRYDWHDRSRRDTSPSVSALQIHEIDADGLLVSLTVFGDDDVDAAYAELERRHDSDGPSR